MAGFPLPFGDFLPLGLLVQVIRRVSTGGVECALEDRTLFCTLEVVDDRCFEVALLEMTNGMYNEMDKMAVKVVLGGHMQCMNS